MNVAPVNTGGKNMKPGDYNSDFPFFRLLDEEKCLKIHGAVVRVLESTGVKVEHDEARKLLAEAGAKVEDNHVVKIPERLLKSALDSAPSGVTVYDRLGQPAMYLEGSKSHYGTGSDLLKTYDVETGELRDSVLRDVANAAKVADACEHLDFVMSSAFPSDYKNTQTAWTQSFKAMAENTTKPLCYIASNGRDNHVIIEMAAEIAGGYDKLREKPFLINYSEPVSPLTHAHEVIDKLLQCADFGVPLAYESGVLSGGTGPVSRAGVMVQSLAECLSGLVIHQLRAPGAPFIGGGATPGMDMLTSICAYSSSSFILGVTGLVEMCRYYGLPSWGFAACTDSFAMDAQSGVEYGIWTLIAHLSGANLIHDCGYLGQGTVGSLESILMADETVGMVKALEKGIEVNADTLSEDVIADVFEGREQFITHEQTLRRFRADHYRPKLLNRYGFNTWDEKGRKDIKQVLNQKAREILNTRNASPLDGKTKKRIDKIAQEYQE